MNFIILKSGTFRESKNNNFTKTELSLFNWFKDILKYLGISFVDPCCPNNGLYPIRYNSNTNKIESYTQQLDGTYSWVEINISN